MWGRKEERIRSDERFLLKKTVRNKNKWFFCIFWEAETVGNWKTVPSRLASVYLKAAGGR